MDFNACDFHAVHPKVTKQELSVCNRTSRKSQAPAPDQATAHPDCCHKFLGKP